MERKIGIKEAKEILRSVSNAYPKRHSRIHKEAAYGNAACRRALEPTGICSHCQNLALTAFFKQGKDRVKLGCEAGKSPLNLYLDLPLGQTPTCEAFLSKEETAVK